MNTAQDVVRPLYGKSGQVALGYGDHPEFEHLKGTNAVEHSPITTLFVDIEASTRLGVRYPLDRVFLFKNAVITSAIDIANAFDGHVHRIMGDAVMAFFGSKEGTATDGVIDALNCASFLKLFVEREVAPALEEEGMGSGFGIRIGLDHGSERNVLWSSYGHQGMSEVTATSFYVDAAAKLQQAAGRNGIMLGNSLRRKIDFPSKLLDVKSYEQDGEEKYDRYLRPNYSDQDGSPLNYKQHVLRGNDYLNCSPLAAPMEAEDSSGPMISEFQAEHYTEKHGTHTGGRYQPVSRTLPKDRWLKFTYKVHGESDIGFPYQVRLAVENHGQEARNAGDLKHDRSYTIDSREQSRRFAHWEHTRYKGLHYLTLEIKKCGEVLCDRRFGVYIE